jgi:hypothetical protein
MMPIPNAAVWNSQAYVNIKSISLKVISTWC